VEFHSDNGSEFINHTTEIWYKQESLPFTRNHKKTMNLSAPWAKPDPQFSHIHGILPEKPGTLGRGIWRREQVSTGKKHLRGRMFIPSGWMNGLSGPWRPGYDSRMHQSGQRVKTGLKPRIKVRSYVPNAGE
jgi:hypothetical protein